MKTKVFVLLLAFTLVATFAFARGEKEAASGAAATSAAAATGEPQYGGTLTAFRAPGQQNTDPPTPSRMASATIISIRL